MSLRPTMAKRPADPVAAGELVAAVMGARVHVDVTIPRTTIAGRLRVLTRAESKQVRAEARKECQRLGLDSVDTSRDFLEEVGTRTIAIAVRQTGNEANALAPLDEWQQCDEEQIAELWQVYKDLEESFDPIGGSCSEVEAVLIAEAAKKKDRTLLRSFGSRRLADYLATSADPPAS